MRSMDDLERYTRKHNLDIHGIPEAKDANLCEQVVILGNLLNLSIDRNEIDICHRMANNNSDQPKSIIERFRSYNAKRDLYAARKHLRGIDPGECFQGTALY